MIKAIFADFYGTIVYEDGEIVSSISRRICETGNAENASQVDSYWWNCFRTSFENSYGDTFKTQRELELQSIQDTIQHFSSTEDAAKLGNEMFEYWTKSPIFPEAKQFFQECPVPIYIVSNIDRQDILDAIAFHDLKPQAVFTSEDAKSYKPRKELFQYALDKTGLKPDEVLHIGDSLGSDIKGAGSVDIRAVWVNKSGRNAPEHVISVSNLLDVLDYL